MNRFVYIRDLKENELLEPTEELCVVSEEIRTLDVRQSIDQLLRSLRLKCESLNKLTFNAFFQIHPITTDNNRVDGIEVSYNNGTIVRTDDQLILMRISGQNEVSEDMKLKAYIKSEIKTEKCEPIVSRIKTEAVG